VNDAISKRRLWVSPKTLKTMLEVSGRPYVGRLPASLVQAMPLQPQALLNALDTLAEILRPLGRLPNGMTVGCILSENGLPLGLKKLGGGAAGSVYQLTVHHQQYALKIYHNIDNAEENTVHGVWAETRVGLYFYRHPLKDIVRFYCANPMAGWVLFELITAEVSLEKRKGPLLNTFPLVFVDNHENNRLHGILIDYGGLQFTPENVAAGPIRLVQASAMPSLYHLPEEARFMAFEEAMNIQEPPLQVSAVTQIRHLPEIYQRKAFESALNTQNPEVQSSAALQIRFLPQAERNAYFELVMAIPKPVVQASAASQIHSLPRTTRKASFFSTMAIQEPGVQSKAVSQIYALHFSERKAAFDFAIAVPNPAVQASAAAQIYALPYAEQKVALASYLQIITNRPDYLGSLQALTLSI
jgi:hypothetical protein